MISFDPSIRLMSAMLLSGTILDFGDVAISKPVGAIRTAFVALAVTRQDCTFPSSHCHSFSPSNLLYVY